MLFVVCGLLLIVGCICALLVVSCELLVVRILSVGCYCCGLSLCVFDMCCFSCSLCVVVWCVLYVMWM